MKVIEMRLRNVWWLAMDRQKPHNFIKCCQTCSGAGHNMLEYSFS